MNQNAFLGFESFSLLKPILQHLRTRKILLVTGTGSYDQCGASEQVKALLSSFSIERFSGFGENLKVEEIRMGVEMFKRIKPEAVVAIGGGSVIDMAKLINMFGSNQIEPEEYLIGNTKLANKGLPCIAVPTTAGAGSEATHFAVMYQGATKYSIASEWMLPDFALIDPQFLLSLSPRLKAISGADALCQAIESYWAVGANGESRFFASESISLLTKNLQSWVSVRSPEIAMHMARAAYFSGKAINISKTTAAHAISYPMTSLYKVPHGQAVSVSLPHILAFNADADERDLAEALSLSTFRFFLAALYRLLGCENAPEAKQYLTKLFREIGLATSLSELGITSNAQRESIIELVNAERLRNNPRVMTQENLRALVSML